LKILQDEVLLRGKWSSQEEPNVRDDKADIFKGSGEKSSCFDDATKGSRDKVHDDVHMSKVSEACGEKGVKKAQVKQEYTPFKVVTVNFDGYCYKTTEFVLIAATSEPIQAHYNSLGVDAMKLYMMLYAISFTVISFIYFI